MVDPGVFGAAWQVLASTLQLVSLARGPPDCPACVCAVDACGAESAPPDSALPALVRSLDVIQDAYQECSSTRAHLRDTCQTRETEGCSQVSLVLLFIRGCLVGSLITIIASCGISLARRVAASRSRAAAARQATLDDTPREPAAALVVQDEVRRLEAQAARAAVTPSSLRANV